jgi:protein gp37
MADRTGIEWTDATWNPIRGCSRVSDGCRNCYAELVAARFSGPGQAYEGLARRRSNGEPQWTGEVRVIESHMLDPIRWQRPRKIFVNSMSDLFHENVSVDTIARVWAVMALAPRHTYQVLTKRAERMNDVVNDPTFYRRVLAAADEIRRTYDRKDVDGFYLTSYPVSDPRHAGFYPQVWLGVSVEHQAAANQRIPLLLDTPAAVRFLSCEPLLGSLQIAEYLPDPLWNNLPSWKSPEIDWVIVGGESGPRARPMHPDWARSLRDQCERAGVPFFFKQWGEWIAEDQSPSDAVLPGQSTAFYGDAGPSLFRIGKRGAGHEIDGHEWHQFPAVIS